MEENQYAIIDKYIDQMVMFCNWEMDTVSYAVGGIVGGIELSGYFSLIFFMAGISLAYFNEKLKNTKYKNYIKHVFYMWGIITPKKRLPPSYIRHFLA